MALGGERHLVWTTFTPSQVDIDVTSAAGEAYLVSILDTLAAADVTLLRMDAVGYAVKTPGSTCFMTPQTFEFIDRFTGLARDRGLDVLVEVHSYYRRQIEIGATVDRVYDFALPPLVLHAAYTGDHAPLARWLSIRPTNAVTVLDTHDGIGVIDVGPDQTTPDQPGLLTPAELDALVETIHERTGGQSRAATGWAASNLDVYQVNSTFYDALGGDPRTYLAARAVQFFTPGVPQVYYVGALAGRNDMELLARTGVGRDINRHHYTAEEVTAALDEPVVVALCALARFRNTLGAFDGAFAMAERGTGLVLTWTCPDRSASLEVDLAGGAASITWQVDGRSHRTDDLLTDPPRI